MGLLAELQSPGAAWRMEEAKLLWAQGQSGMAVRLLQAMVDGLKLHPASSAQGQIMHARLLTLTGKWLARTRC